MIVHRMLVFSLIMVGSSITLPLHLLAACPPNSPTAVQVSVAIGSEPVLTLPDSVSIPTGNHSGVMFSGNPVVWVGCDATGDKIVFENVVLTASSPPITNFPITFWATFDNTGAPASPTAPPTMSYKLTGSGSFNNPPTALNKIRVDGWATINSVQQYIGYLSKTTTAGGTSSFYISPTAKWYNVSTMNGSRQLKVTVLVTLRDTTSSITLPSGQGVSITNDTAQGTPVDNASFWCMTTNVTARALGCETCMTEDGMVAENHKLHMFAKSNWDNLSQDIARGQGEHLASVAALLRVPAERRPAFFAYAQDQYQQVIRQGKFDPDAIVGALQRSEEVPTLLASRKSGLTSQ